MVVKLGLIVREEHNLRAFENRALRKIFGPKWDDVTEELRRLHSEELYDLHLPNIIWMIKSRVIIWAGNVARMGAGRSAYRVLVGIPEGKRPLGRPRLRWEDNITIYFHKVVWRACSALI